MYYEDMYAEPTALVSLFSHTLTRSKNLQVMHNMSSDAYPAFSVLNEQE